MVLRNKIRSLFLFFLLLTMSFTWADKGHLNLGIGIGVASIPHYVGSADSHFYVIPFPFFEYESDKVKVDRGAATGTLWQKGPWSLVLDASLRIPVKSEDSDVREGMPDLDLLLELGPALKVDLKGKKKAKHHIYVELPWRGAVSTDFSDVEPQGWISEPKLLYVNRQVLDRRTLKTTLGFGGRWLSKDYGNYYYGVADEYETDERPAFQLDDELVFSGWQWRGGVSLRDPKWLLGAYVRYSWLDNSDLLKSPLVKERQSVEAGIAFSWLFYHREF